MTPMEMLFLIFGISTAAMSVLAAVTSRTLRREAVKEHPDRQADRAGVFRNRVHDRG